MHRLTHAQIPRTTSRRERTDNGEAVGTVARRHDAPREEGHGLAVLVQLQVQRHEAGEGHEVGVGDLVEQRAGFGGAAEVRVATEELAGDGLVVRVQAMGDGPGVDLFEIEEGLAVGE
jgi:hypothetical protein